MAAVFSEIKFT